MVYTVTRAIIAGGGIVGRALLRAGMEVIVAEKADAIRAAGATLGLWANAVRAFDDLDVDVRSASWYLRRLPSSSPPENASPCWSPSTGTSTGTRFPRTSAPMGT